MKKTAFLLGFVLALMSCSKNNDLVGTPELRLDFSIADGTEPETRGVKKDWIHNDKLYLFFDKKVNADLGHLTVKYDNSGSITGSKKTWYVDEWTPGLKEEIMSRTSGTVSILYMPNDKVDGSIWFSYDANNQRYNLRPQDRAGNEFWSYYLEAVNVSYTIKNGVMTLSATMALPSDLHFIQFCIEKGLDGKNIPNGDSHYYRLSVNSGNSKFIQDYTLSGYGKDGKFLYRNTMMDKGLSAYYYQGLCFAGVPYGYTGEAVNTTFVLKDSKNDKVYTYTAKTALDKKAYKLPDLNKWQVVQ